MEYLAEHPEAGLVGQANRVERAVQALRRQKRLLLRSGASRAEIQGIEAAITERMAALNQAMQEAAAQ